MKVCEEKDYCYVEMPEGDASIKYHHGVTSMRAPFAIYTDVESLLKKWIHALMIQINHQQQKQISIKCVVIHWLHNVHST